MVNQCWGLLGVQCSCWDAVHPEGSGDVVGVACGASIQQR